MSCEQVFSREIKERPGQLRIGVDIDGCVALTGVTGRKIITERTGIDAVSLYKRKNGRLYYFNDWAEFADNPEALKIIDNLYNEPMLYQEAPAVPGAVKRLQAWHRYGHELWFITARPLGVKTVTLEWFSRAGLGWVTSERLIFPNGQGAREQFKAKTSRELKLHAFIEDHGPTLEAISNPELLVKILLGRRYNTLDKIGTDTCRHRSWKKVEELINEASLKHFKMYAS